MALSNIQGPATATAATNRAGPHEKFADVAKASVPGPPREPGAVKAGPSHAQRGVDHATGTANVQTGPPNTRAEATRVAERVLEAQRKLDTILELAQSGKTFTSAELLALQAQVYGSSQELDLAGKVVEKATSGLKTLLQTQL